MKPVDKKVIEMLNDVLSAELAAISQYFVHAEMCDNWGYHRLYEAIRKSSFDEMKHAEKLIERILYFEGIPNLQRLGKITIGETVVEQLQLDLALEKEAVTRLNTCVHALRELGDTGTATILEEMLESEEEHVNWLEAQHELVKQIGAQNYLAQQVARKD
jgi:bacterioferritin